MALTTTAQAQEVSYRTTSTTRSWNNAILNLWDDLSDDGKLANPGEPVDDDPMASLSVKRMIQPGDTQTFVFF